MALDAYQIINGPTSSHHPHTYIYIYLHLLHRFPPSNNKHNTTQPTIFFMLMDKIFAFH